MVLLIAVTSCDYKLTIIIRATLKRVDDNMILCIATTRHWVCYYAQTRRPPPSPSRQKEPVAMHRGSDTLYSAMTYRECARLGRVRRRTKGCYLLWSFIQSVARHLSSLQFRSNFATCPCCGHSHYVCYCSDDLKANDDSYHLFIHLFSTLQVCFGF